MAIDLKFVSKCVADGCENEKLKDDESQLCEDHKRKKEKGEDFKVYNGKKVRE